MYPVIEIYGCCVPVYLLCTMAGFSASVLLASHLLLERLILRKYIAVLLLSCIGLFAGARFFGILSKLMEIYFAEGVWKWKECIKESGLVYFGGLLGYLLSLRILCCFKGRKWEEISNVTAVIIPLFHVFGRIGCYFAGCCYGAESDSWLAVPYRIALKNGEWTDRIPVQLIEATLEFCLFIVFWCCYQRKKRTGRLCDNTLLHWYMILYATVRFILEFWRGDEVRGVLGWISFSQVISLLIFLKCLYDIIFKKTRGYESYV